MRYTIAFRIMCWQTYTWLTAALYMWVVWEPTVKISMSHVSPYHVLPYLHHSSLWYMINSEETVPHHQKNNSWSSPMSLKSKLDIMFSALSSEECFNSTKAITSLSLMFFDGYHQISNWPSELEGSLPVGKNADQDHNELSWIQQMIKQAMPGDTNGDIVYPRHRNWHVRSSEQVAFFNCSAALPLALIVALRRKARKIIPEFLSMTLQRRDLLSRFQVE